MPKVAIRFAESAIADTEAIRTWYSEQGVPDVGDRFVEDIVKRIEVLRDHPDMGRIVPEFDRPFLRKLIHSHHLPPRSEARTGRARLAQRKDACPSGGQGHVRQDARVHYDTVMAAGTLVGN